MRLSGMPPLLRALLGICLAVFSSGCARVHSMHKSPLSQPRIARDSIAVEKYSVRFPHGDPQLDQEIWSEIDEECLPSEVRTRLAANGFRAGVVGVHLPVALDTVLREKSAGPPAKPVRPAAVAADAEESIEPVAVDLLHEPRVRRSLWQTRAGQSGLVVTAGEQTRIPQVPVLVRGDDGRVTGRSYDKVMGALSMKLFPEPDGRVRLEIVPQLEYGEPRSRFIAHDGMIKPDYRPETIVFQDLRLDTILSPGQTLVIGTRAEKPGSLGHHFFTEQRSAEAQEQKLLLIRLAHAPEEERYRDSEIPSATP
jgi:hypothetical protein